jgi:hypothetical protein
MARGEISEAAAAATTLAEKARLVIDMIDPPSSARFSTRLAVTPRQ